MRNFVGVAAWAVLFVSSAFGQSRWPDERAAGAFVFHADFSLANYETLLAQISQLQRDLKATLAVQEAQEPIHLFLFQHESTYRAYLREYFPHVPFRRAMFIKNRGPGMVFAHRGSDFEIDVRHESTHALLHAALPMVPLWLDEGLAEYFEMPAEKRPHDHPHLTPTKWAARLGQSPKLERLESFGELSQMGRGEYRQAWSWTHFMLHESPESRDELLRFLADIQARTPPGRLSERLRRRLPNLEQRFVDHFRKWKKDDE